MKNFIHWFTPSLLALNSLFADAPQPPAVPANLPPLIEVLQPGVKMTLLAEHPDLVTPTGVDVDDRGRIYLVSNHTHFRPAGYAGPEHDEILVFEKDGKNRRVFYSKTKSTMHVKVGPDGWIYLAERSRVLRIKDTDGDGMADVEENIASLDTLADYPHNGLSGMAWHPDGGLIFALGENFGRDWTLMAKDGTRLNGRGEGGVFRCRPDGSGLRRIARGFWNPFGLLVRDNGEIFAVDNDPGSRPPCRLLQVIDGADYGFQWVYGSAPVHPFVAWNGELRGTLPMIHPSGEGPCALVELGGGVLVPSWSHHRIDYFPLERKGAGYVSERIEVLRGGEYFRPVCIAPGPDGAFYLTDWVFSSYELHGRGRLWKLEIDPSLATWRKPSFDPPNAAANLAASLREGKAKFTIPQLFEYAQDRDAYLSDAALTALARESISWTPDSLRALPDKDRLWGLVALRRVDLQEEKWVRALIGDSNPEVRFECLRWIADGVLVNFSADVEKMLSQPDLDYRMFEALLATTNTLRGNPGAGVTDGAVLMERIANAATPLRLKAFALRLLPPNDSKLGIPVLRELLAAGDATLTLEVVRTLVSRNEPEAKVMLADIAADSSRGAQLRAEAIPGLPPDNHPLLVKLASDENPAVREEALRALRFSVLNEAEVQKLREIEQRHPESGPLVKTLLAPATLAEGRPALADTDAWLKRLESLPGKPNPEAGRRLFFHQRMALCASCHRHSGRGNVVGPHLSLIGRQGDLKSVLQSILDPNHDVAPQFFPTQLKLKDGTDFTGILLRSSNVDVFRDLTGQERVFKPEDIQQRVELKASLMPAGLPSAITDEELRDLLAFLRDGSP